MRKSVLMIAVCLLLGGLAVAGCGGDDDDGSAGAGGDTAAGNAAGGEESGGGEGGGSAGEEASSLETTSESKAEYTAKANEVCKERRREIRTSVTGFLQEQDADTGVEVARREFVDEILAPGLEAEAEELRELGAPQGEEAQVEAIVAAIEAMASEVREDPRRYMTNPREFQDANQLARGYGIPACGTIA